MKHFYNDIIGWMTFERFYRDMVLKYPSGSKFVEVGTYEGKSFAYLCVEMVNAEKSFDLTVIDSFTFGDEKTGESILDVFRRNLKPFEGRYKVIKDCSWEAAECFADNSIDVILIDADHIYESVKKDILAFLPKMKSGGVMAGHDYCDERYYPNEHPGVAQAVHEIFGDDWDKGYLDEKLWVKHIK